MMNAHVLDSLPAYALGDLEGDELLAVARHLPGCPECRAALVTYWRAADELPQVLPLRDPPPDLRARVLARVSAQSAQAAPVAAPQPAVVESAPKAPRAERAASPPAGEEGWMQRLGRMFWPKAALAGLALVLVIALVATVGSLLRQGIPASPVPQDVRLVELAGDESTPATTGYLMVFPGENNGSLTVDHAPALEPGKQYQAWLILDGQRTSGGVFSVNEDGYGVLQITSDRPLDSFDALGVTIEPEGGSPGPTGPRVLGGDL